MTYATRSWTQWLSVHVDRLAIGLSGLCVVHCLASAVLLALLASAGGILLNPIYHEVGLSLAIGLGVIALGRGALIHGYMMPLARSEEHTSELQSLMRISYAVFCLKKKKTTTVILLTR